MPGDYADPQSHTESVRSPLHRLQADLAKDMPFGYTRTGEPAQFNFSDDHQRSPTHDTQSLYSFDSVSTTGRLLDRLDLDADEYAENELLFRRRESVVLTQSTGRLLDRLGLEESAEDRPDPRQKPIRANSSAGIDRIRAMPHPPVRSYSQSSKVPLKSTPYSIVQQRGNFSIDSLQADVVLSLSSTPRLVSAEDLTGKIVQTKVTPMRSASKVPVSSPIFESYTEAQLQTPQTHSSSPLNRPTELPFYKSGLNSSRQLTTSSNGSSSSLETAIPVFNPCALFDQNTEVLTKKALQVMAQGNLREAAYQLHLLASPPNNYPRAMLYYAKALRGGQGVKLNDAQSLRWLYMCVITSHALEQNSAEALSKLMAKLTDLSSESLLSLAKQHLSSSELDPFHVYEYFRSVGPSSLSKLMQFNASDKNVLGGAYYLIGELLVLGQGVAKDEESGRLFLAKAAASGYPEAAVKLGELWGCKTKAFKKDFHIAAVWLRLGELFGHKDLGNSWIYKEKYMERKKK